MSCIILTLRVLRPPADPQPQLDSLLAGKPVSVEAQLFEIAADVLGRPVDGSETLADTDSMSGAHIISVVQERLGVSLPLSAWFQASSIGDIARCVLRAAPLRPWLSRSV